MNKRASIEDTIFIGIALMCFIVAVTIGFYINSMFASNPLITANPTAGNITAITTGFYCGTPDNLGMAIFFGSMVIAVMLAYLFGQNPIFKAITIVFLILFTGVTVIFQMWWEGYSASSAIASVIACLPKTGFIMNHFVVAGLLCSVLILIALFYKGKGEQSAF
jgi:LPXTG-motif cell wall-anchored protein